MDFSTISALFVVAAVCASIAKMLKQPLLVGYIFAGFLLSYLGLVHELETFSGLGQIGVALLLFLVGLDMDLQDLPSVGKVALFTGLSQIVFTTTTGFLISTLFGYSLISSLYIGIAISFSSTIIIVKLLSEKKDLGSLYGKISVGFLLVQDLVAVIILMFLAGVRSGSMTPAGIGLLTAKGVILLLATWIVSKKILPTLFDKVFASSQELLFIASVAWALGVSAFVGGPLGFTLEIGGFLAGLALSNLPEHLQIASRTRPLRDFFLTIFFMILGTQLVVDNIALILVPSVVFSFLVFVGNPLVIISILGILGYTRRTSFLSGLTVAQISEFSLIIMAMGLAVGHVTNDQVSIVVLVAVATMTLSTYTILGAEKIYKKIHKYLKFFERQHPKETAVNLQNEFKDHVVVIGADRTGKSVIAFLKRKKIPFLVVDFNPKVFKSLDAEKVPCIFGDISELDIFDQAGIHRSRLVLSTISSVQPNLFVLDNINKFRHTRPLTIFTAADREEGLRLYEKGADYVVVPQRVAGEHIRHIIGTYGFSEERIKKLGKSNFNRLIRK